MINKGNSVLNLEFKKEVSKVLKKFKKSLYELHDLATRDDKTGLYNHRFFTNVFEIELEKARRGKQNISLAMLDIDCFKKYNDKYGHVMGDEILYDLAQTLLKTTRKYDVLARFGGEEFLVLLPETPLSKAKKAAERMRKGLYKNNKLKKYGITISIGVTEYKDKDTMKKMITRTDKALYQSKQDGRNRVTAI
ncbi:MAG: GGDEF domain-containing protein [archaeon]|nr:GGDEF domain-containing protein [archaeon]MCR4323710.1 GGDEF domain-containing protein [Nanoarchaeota archaeon]